MTRRRLLTLIAGAIAAVVLVGSAILASSGSSSARSDALVLDGHPPHSVELALTLSTVGSLRTSGTIWMDFAKSTLRATLLVPVVTADTNFDLRAVGHRLYLTSPNLADATGPVWYVQTLTWPALTPLEKIVLRPNAAFLTVLANARITHDGQFTTYELKRSNVSLGTFSPTATSASVPGTLDLTVTTGRRGEFTALWARLTSKNATTTIALRVLSYNPVVSIVAPPTSRATTPAGPLLSQLFSSGALGSLVVPAQLLHLFSGSKLG